MKAKRWNKCKSRVATQLLTWLGIGSSALLFMACYGPAPKNYQAEPYSLDSIEYVDEDQVEMVEESDTVAVADEQR